MEVKTLHRHFGGVADANKAVRPQPGLGLRARVPWGFLCVVVLPLLLAGYYYTAIAADQFISEAKFVVHSANRQTPTGLGTFLTSVGLSHTPDQAYAVGDYITSRDAAGMLARDHGLRAVLGRPEADFLTRYPNLWFNDSFEDLYRRYRDAVSVSLDSTSGITTLTVRSFRAADSYEIATALLAGGEALVNKINGRARSDAITAAEAEVARAEQRVTLVQTALGAFRNRQNMIDPAKASSGLQDLIGRLSGELAQSQTQLSQLQSAAPLSPQIPALRTRILALGKQIAEEQAKVVGTGGSIATSLGDYERLLLQREFADKSLSSAIGSLEAARVDAQRQQLYLDRVVAPNLPDDALYPRRLAFMGTIAAGLLLTYGIGWLLLAGIREHQA